MNTDGWILPSSYYYKCLFLPHEKEWKHQIRTDASLLFNLDNIIMLNLKNDDYGTDK